MRFSIVSRLAAAGALVFTMAACGTEGAPSDTERPVVVATTTQVGSIAEELGGDAIDLTVLLSPGVEAHDFALTPAQAAALEQADLILISGAELETWLDDTIEAAGAEDRVRDLSEGVTLRTPGEGEPVHRHDDDEHGHDDEDGHHDDDDEHGHDDEDGHHDDDDEHGHDDEDGHHDDDDEHGHDDGHGHGETDPHYWMTASNAIVMVQNARAALVEVAPEDAEGIEERAAALIARLEAADDEVRRLIDEIPQDQRKLVTDHDAMGYFVDEYGLTFVGSIFPSLDVSSEPSARDVELLVQEIRAAGVTAIFTESSVNPRLARAIADEAGARLVTEPIYTDSLGEEGSGAETIDGMLIHNATVIRDGLTGD
jgi:zinc/manganese transport system substrate-binding protein